MSIKKVPEGYYVDCRGKDGSRHRRTFTSRDDARDFEFRMKYAMAATSDGKGKLLNEAIKGFSDVELRADGPYNNREKRYLKDLYDFLVDELELTYLHEVEPYHMDMYQTILRDRDKRVELWKKIENNRRLQCVESGQGYLPRRMENKEVQKLSGNSIRRRFVILKAFFAKAKFWKWIDHNPCSELVIKGSEVTSRKPWTTENINRAIAEASGWAVKPFWLVAVTGMRPVGACRLEVPDLDFEERKFWVTSYKGKGGIKRRHEIYMTKELFNFFQEVVEEVKNRRMIGPLKDRLFLSAANRELKSMALGDEMRRITAKLKLDGFSLYGFRHSMATAAANASKNGKYVGNLEVARQILGHATISQTADYNHTDDSLIREQYETLSKIRNIPLPRGGHLRKI